MAAIAASLMWRGVGKCGSPAPKSTRLAPWARSLAASAATAMVAETSIRPIRSAKTFEGAETVIAPLSLQIFDQPQNRDTDGPIGGPVINRYLSAPAGVSARSGAPARSHPHPG